MTDAEKIIERIKGELPPVATAILNVDASRQLDSAYNLLTDTIRNLQNYREDLQELLETPGGVDAWKDRIR